MTSSEDTFNHFFVVFFQFMAINGRYLSSDDIEFTEKVFDEIKAFNDRQSDQSVLVFPPLLPRYRYLFHELTQKYFANTLGTVSIGTEGNRRPLLYFKSATNRRDMSETNHLVSDSRLPVSEVKLKNCRKSGKNSNKANDRRNRRPDMKLYVPPKAKTNSSADESEDQSSAQICDQKTSETIDSLSELEIRDSSHPTDHKCLIPSSNDNERDKRQETIQSDETIDEIQINCKTNNEEAAEENSWDTLFDENGDCIQPEFVHKVNDLICDKTSSLKLEKSRIDYSNFEYNEPEVDNSEFAHILEVYDFDIELKTQDLMTSISVFNSRDFDVKWVDDTHALIVFSTANAANEALKYNYPNIKLRPLSQAIRESKLKARKCSEFLQPYRQRPQTSASLARRLVTQSLGLRERISPEQRAAERKKLAEAKERKRMAVRQGIDVWEGNVS